MVVLSLMLLFLISSCSPKYKVVKTYIPPQNKACVNKCKLRLAECKDKCFENYRKCLKESLQRAEKVYEELYEDYRKELENYYLQYKEYISALERFRIMENSLKKDFSFYDRICKKFKDEEACSRRDYLKRFLINLPYERPVKPMKPIKPRFEAILKREREACNCDCNCTEEYDVCFQSCGGKIKVKKICVENCER